VNRRTAVFVTRTKHVLVARARDPLCPAYDNYHPFLRDKAKG
jgi:hypothetical protein